MNRRFLTFDGAQTLLRVDFNPGAFAVDCAEACSVFPGETGRAVFLQMLISRWAEYRRVNEARAPDQCDAFWITLVADWLTAIHEDRDRAMELLDAGHPLLYGPESRYFKLFEDTIPALDRLDALGVRMGVISNWDYTLERVLRNLQIYDRFEFVFASMVEGQEKPSPAFFRQAVDCFGAEPPEVIHVGDNPLDDVEGARAVGMRALLLNRDRVDSEGGVIHSLLAIPEAAGWC